MIKIRKSEDRGHVNLGWLDSRHSFSFASYYDPQHMGFRSLRVINDDTVAGGGGFDTHPHRDMEIITYVLSGALQHRDSMGNTAVMKAGDLQRISAGTGIEHSEFNFSPIDPVHLLQIWILPERKGFAPGYAEKSFGSAPAGRFTLVASRDGREGSVAMNQDAEILLAKFTGGESVTHRLRPQRHAWLQVAEGEIALNGQPLKPGDAACVSGETELRLGSKGRAQALLFDLN